MKHGLKPFEVRSFNVAQVSEKTRYASNLPHKAIVDKKIAIEADNVVPRIAEHPHEHGSDVTMVARYEDAPVPHSQFLLCFACTRRGRTIACSTIVTHQGPRTGGGEVRGAETLIRAVGLPFPLASRSTNRLICMDLNEDKEKPTNIKPSEFG